MKLAVIGLTALIAAGCAQPSDAQQNSGSAGATQTGSAASGGLPGVGGSGTGVAGSNGQAGAGVSDTLEAQSGTRLKAYWYTTADGAKQFASMWYDSQLQTDCQMYAAPDGSTRCVPPLGATVYYGDAGCGTVIIGFSTCQPSSMLPMVSAYVADSSTCGGGRYRPYRVGSSRTGSVFAKSGTACTDVTSSVSTVFSFYNATELDQSMFQTVNRVHD